MNLGTRLLAD